MKKIILNLIAVMITAFCIAQQGNRICFNYENNAGWSEDKHHFTLTGCSGLTFLPASTVQGVHSFAGGQLRLNSIQDASMNRMYRTLPQVLGNTFITDFEARVDNPANGLVGYILVALTQSDIAPWYDFSTSCALTPTSNSAIMVYAGNSGSGGAVNVDIVCKSGSTVTTSPTGFTMNNGTVYYFRIIRESLSRLTFEVYNNSERTNLIKRTSCINIDPAISELKFLQHANHPAGGLSRITNGYINNVCININPDLVCCTPKITGNNTICEAATPATFLVNAVAGNTYNWILPAGVTGTPNATNSQITITNWGVIDAIPKRIDIKVKMLCHCDSFIVTYPVYVYPKRDPSFNIQGLGTNGNILTNFQAVGNSGIIGTINHWEIREWNAVTQQEVTINPLRNVSWQTASVNNGPSVFNVISVGTAAGAPYPNAAAVVYPFQNLVRGKFYIIKHGMYYNGGVCDWKGTSMVFYVGLNSMIKMLGDPNAADFKSKLKEINLQEKLN